MARSKKELFSFNDILKMTNKYYEISEKQLNTFLEDMFYEFGVVGKRTNERTENDFKKTYWGLIWKRIWVNGIRES